MRKMFTFFLYLLYMYFDLGFSCMKTCKNFDQVVWSSVYIKVDFFYQCPTSLNLEYLYLILAQKLIED